MIVYQIKENVCLKEVEENSCYDIHCHSSYEKGKFKLDETV